MKAKSLLTSLCLTLALSFGVAEPQIASAQASAKQFASSVQARDIIQEILDVVGLKPRFEIREADNIDNAAAVVYGGKRYVLYDKAFVARINNAVNTDWAGVSILAHEIGHHLNGHTLDSRGSSRVGELEADEFSGFVLRKLGASLKDAQAAMATLSSKEASSTHPGRAERLTAIETGWKQADAQILAEASPHNKDRVRASTTPAPQPTVAKTEVKTEQKREVAASHIDSKNILREVVFINSPNHKIYLTKRMNLVRETAAGIEIIGKVAKSNSKRFPYIIYDETAQLYVAQNGTIVNSRNQQVGYLKEHLA
ncbi:MAG TPA: membrane-binding protein [Patescibacteria group bacterium]|nr:membrane-binding protein [Patescibacteria group bacterium]